MRLLGAHVVVRDSESAGDTADLIRWMNLAEWQYWNAPDQMFKPKKRLVKRRPQADQAVWQIDTPAGQHIGWIGYHALDERTGRASLGIALPEETNWGRGYGTEALTLFLDYLFAEMGLAEVRVGTWTGNVRMVTCAKRAGFHEVERGAHRAEISVRGEPLERIVLAISRGEWQALNLERAGASAIAIRARLNRSAPLSAFPGTATARPGQHRRPFLAEGHREPGDLPRPSAYRGSQRRGNSSCTG